MRKMRGWLAVLCVCLSLFMQAAHAEESLGRICDLFPDTSFAQSVANMVTGGDVSAEVTQEMLDGIYGLSVSDCGNWEGLSIFGEELEHLEVMNGGGNVEELSALTGLQSLSLIDVTATGTDFDLSSLDQLTLFRSIGSTYAENTRLSLPDGLEELDLHTSANLNLTTDELASVSALQKVRVVEAPLSGEVSKLKSPQKLTEIHLCDNAVSGSLADFSGMNQLKALNLTRVNVQGDLSSLSGLSSLEELEVAGMDITGDLSVLSDLSSLHTIHLGPKDNRNQNSRVKGDLSALSGLSKLKNLALEFNEVSGSFSSLSGLKNLEYLSMQYTQASGSLRDLCGLTKLNILQIGYGVDFDFAVDSSILNLKNLNVINLNGAKVSGEIGLVESLPSLWSLNMIDATIVLEPIVFEDDQPIAVDIPAFFKDLPLTPVDSDQAYTVSGDQIIWNVPGYTGGKEGGNIYYRFDYRPSDGKGMYTVQGNVQQPFTKPRVYLGDRHEVGKEGNKEITGLETGKTYAISSPSFPDGENALYRITKDGEIGSLITNDTTYDEIQKNRSGKVIGLENYTEYSVYNLTEEYFTNGRTSFDWEEIVDGSYALSRSTLTVTKNGDTYTIDGGQSKCEIRNVVIGTCEECISFGEGTYIFKNVVLADEFKVISVEGETYQIRLESSVDAKNCNLNLNAGYSIYSKYEEPIRYYNGTLNADIFCDTQEITADAGNDSKITLNNTGSTGGITMEIYESSEASAVNKGDLGGIVVQTDRDSDVEFVNEGDCVQIYAWAFENSRLEFVNHATVGLVATGAECGADVRFVNHGEITNTTPDPDRYDGNEWGDYAVMIDIDEQSHLEFTGSGKIHPGVQMFDYLCQKGQIGPIDGPSVVYDIRQFVPGDDRAENVERIKEIASHVDFNWKQIEQIDGAKWAVAVHRDTEVPENTYVVTLTDENDTQDGGIVDSEDAFEEMPPVEAPTLILPDGVQLDASVMLKYDEPNANKNNTVVYNVELIGYNGEEVELPGECILCFPYPKGLDENSTNKYRIIIHHYADNGKTEVFKSEDGDIEFTKQGICIRVSSFSPFEITWEEQPEVELPKTGDSSRIGLWLALFVLAGAALTFAKRRAA